MTTTRVTPVKAARGDSSAFPKSDDLDGPQRFHIDNGSGYALCRPDYPLNPETAHLFEDWAPRFDFRCDRNGCRRVWDGFIRELDAAGKLPPRDG